MITVGIDVGTQSVKAVILKDGEAISRGKAFSGFDPAKAAEQAFGEALEKSNLSLSDVNHVTATGSGMDMAPNSNSTVSMMGADAKAGVYLFPTVRTIIDVGAEEARAVKISRTDDLTVKVSGDSAVFVDLPRSLQDDIVSRTEFCEA